MFLGEFFLNADLVDSKLLNIQLQHEGLGIFPSRIASISFSFSVTRCSLRIRVYLFII